MSAFAACRQCLYFANFPLSRENGETYNENVCMRQAPTTNEIAGKPAGFRVISFPDLWTCGEGVNGTTLVSYSYGVTGNPVQGPQGPIGPIGPAGPTGSPGAPGADGASGAFIKLATMTASNSATLSDTTHIISTYDTYEFVFENIVPVTSGSYFKMQVSTDAGSTWKSTSYWEFNGMGNDAIYLSNTFYGQIRDGSGNPGGGVSNTAGIGLSGTVRLYGPNQTTNRKLVTGGTYWLDTLWPIGGGATPALVGAYWDGGNTAINAVRFLMSSGNISSGKIRMYGVQ